jgi:OMF family outer membrane factor
VQPITLQQAIELGERNSRTLQISVQQLERSRAGLRQQKASLYPTVGVNAGITTSRSAGGELSRRSGQANSSLFQGSGFQSGNDRNSASFSGSLNLDYNIFTFGLRPAQIRAAEQQVRSDELQVEITREQLRLDVANDYYSLQEADESVRIAEVSVQTNRINRRDAVRLREAGLGTQFSVLQADVELANALQQLANAQAQVQIRRRQLAVRIAAPQTIDLATADPIEVAGNWNLTLDDSIILAIKNRAELSQFLAQRNLSAEQRRAALASLAPAITVSAQYNTLDSFNDQIGVGDGYSATLGYAGTSLMGERLAPEPISRALTLRSQN